MHILSLYWCSSLYFCGSVMLIWRLSSGTVRTHTKPMCAVTVICTRTSWECGGGKGREARGEEGGVPTWGRRDLERYLREGQDTVTFWGNALWVRDKYSKNGKASSQSTKQLHSLTYWHTSCWTHSLHLSVRQGHFILACTVLDCLTTPSVYMSFVWYVGTRGNTVYERIVQCGFHLLYTTLYQNLSMC